MTSAFLGQPPDVFRGIPGGVEDEDEEYVDCDGLKQVCQARLQLVAPVTTTGMAS